MCGVEGLGGRQYWYRQQALNIVHILCKGWQKTSPQYHPPHSASSVPQSLYEGEQFACQSPIQAFVWPVSPVWSIVIFFTVIIIITPKSICKLQDKDTRHRQQEF